MSLESLNQAHGIPSKVSFVAGKNGMTRADLTLHGASASVYLLGATVTSFQDEPGKDIIWVSETANYAPGKAIRGGVPICWPQFGPGALIQHGFARTSQFTVAGTQETDSSVSVTLRLTESEETLKLWAYKFVLDITVELIASGPQKASLRMQISVENKSSSPLSFTTAMHTYFTAPHIHDVAITPLQQHNYFDKLSNSEKVQEEAAVTISSETDRVYYKMPSKVEIATKEKSQAFIAISQEHFTDVVIWNPGAEKAKGMADLSDWKNFVCVESGVIQHPINVPAGESWKAHQVITRPATCSL